MVVPTAAHSRFECVIIGAGLAGLAAARQLAKAGQRVVILEARQRIGGRVCTLKDPVLPCPVDLGATEIHGYAEGNPLKVIAEQIGMDIVVPSEKEWTIYSPEGPPLQSKLSRRLQNNVYDTMFQASIEHAQIHASPTTTESLASYLFHNQSPLFAGLSTEKERQYATDIAKSWQSWTSADFSDVSLKYWGFTVDFESESAYTRHGFGQFVDWLWKEADEAGVELRLGYHVTRVERAEDGQKVTVTATTLDGDEVDFIAPHCICTIPLGVLQNHPPQFSPPLSVRRREAMNRLGVGSFTKIFIAYPCIWWPQDTTYSYILPSHNSTEDLDCGDASKILGQCAIELRNLAAMKDGAPVLVMDFGPPTASQLEFLEEEEIASAVHALLSRHFLPGAERSAPEPLKCIVTRWNSDPLAMGAYVFIPPATSPTAEAPTPLDFIELSKPLWDGRLGFAGEHTSLDYWASAHGAWLSGEREASRVEAQLHNLGEFRSV